ncbi:hypothetical protein KIN20_003581 [Parelaphostrongylus tenuis]|uniref:Protein kinase domain-containing protein n=1 Tax=Parelaphostrongylus tenuis TaxID=148309 RepID=A0AAD5QHH2_PARTN|nr:hypothetical protein KIN20_003581 [Parelaphostrongylus tenuis]
MIAKYAFDSVNAMIKYHLSKKESMTKISGEGAFGELHVGKLRLKNGNKVGVAVKLVRDLLYPYPQGISNCYLVATLMLLQAKLQVLTKDQIKEIMHEARLMKNFDHPNVIKFCGVAAGQEPLMVVIELVNLSE